MLMNHNDKKILAGVAAFAAYPVLILVFERIGIWYYHFWAGLIVVLPLFVMEREGVNFKLFPLAFAFGFVFSFFYIILSLKNIYYNNSVLDGFSLKGLFMGLIAWCIVVPLIEEKIFRGVVFDWVSGHFGVLVASLGTSLFFAGYHGNKFFPALVLALILCFAKIKLKFGSFERLVVHGVVNCAVILWTFGIVKWP